MRFSRHLAALILLTGPGLAQNRPASGATLKVVVVENELSGPPVGNITLSVDGQDASPAATDPVSGAFTFVFPDKSVGDPVVIRVKAKGYVVVNNAQFPINLPKDPDKNPVPIIICKSAVQEEMRSRYYLRISSQEIKAGYAQQIKDLEDRHLADVETIERLSKDRDKAIVLATKTANEFAKQDIEKASDLYRKAMQLFLSGKVQNAIQLLDEEKLNSQLEAANQQEAAATASKEQIKQEWLLKGRLLTLQFRFWEADRAYKNAIDSSPGDMDAIRAYAIFEENEKLYEAQNGDIFKCTSPCGPHGPYSDALIDRMDLPNARATTGSSLALARQLSNLIDEGNLLVRQCLWNANLEFLSNKEIEWQAKVTQLLSPSLDPRLINALSEVNSKQLGGMNNNRQEIANCNSTRSEITLLTMYYNQLTGVGD